MRKYGASNDPNSLLSSNIDRFLQIMARNFTILIKRFRDCVRTYTYYHNLTISSLFTVRRDPSNSLPTALQVCVYLVDFWPLEFTVFLKRSFWPEVDALKIQYTKNFFIKILITEYLIYRWKILRSTNPEIPKVQLFISNCFELPSDWLSQ